MAIFHSIILFWMFLFIVQHEVIWANGRVGDYSVMGNVIYTVIQNSRHDPYTLVSLSLSSCLTKTRISVHAFPSIKRHIFV